MAGEVCPRCGSREVASRQLVEFTRHDCGACGFWDILDDHRFDGWLHPFEFRRFSDSATKDGVETGVEAVLETNRVRWYWYERTQFHDGDSATEDQDWEAFLASGPPAFARGFPEDRLGEMRRIMEEWMEECW